MQKNLRHIIDRSIAELLFRHNCVIIPGLGGFIGNYEPARIIRHGQKITPPSKALLFNNNLVNNDGLLIQHVAKNSNLVYDEAKTWIADFVQEVNSTLNEGNRFEIENVGFLFQTEPPVIGFEQDRSFNLYMNAYGLGNLSFVTFAEDIKPEQKTATKPRPVQEKRSVNKEVKKERPTPNAPVQEKQRPKVQTPIFKVAPEYKTTEKDSSQKQVNAEKTLQRPVDQETKRRFSWKYAAAALALPLIFYSLWIPMQSDVIKTKVLHVEDFNPFYTTPKEQYSPGLIPYESAVTTWKKDTIDFSKITPQTEAYNVPFFGNKMATVLMNKKAESKKDNKAVALKKHHLIVGSFAEKGNANDIIHSLKQKGYKAIIAGKNEGLYRVSAVQAEQKDDLISRRSQLKSDGFKSWVLSKK